MVNLPDDAGPFQLGTTTWYGMYNVWTAVTWPTFVFPMLGIQVIPGLLQFSSVQTSLVATANIPIVPTIVFSIYGADTDYQGIPICDSDTIVIREGDVQFAWSPDGTTWTVLRLTHTISKSGGNYLGQIMTNNDK